MLEATPGNPGKPHAYELVGGFTVARQQAKIALALGAERIVCFANGLAPELIELQHLVETSGAQFHVVSQSSALIGLVRATDEVIVLEDGLFAAASQVEELLEPGQAILVQPIDQGLAEGFQRIDLEQAYGGAMRIPGRLIEQLSQLPADSDASSALLRIALQAGIRRNFLPPFDRDHRFWTKVRSEEQAHALEPLWIRQRTSTEGQLGPTNALALAGVRRFGPALLHAGSGARVLTIAAVVLVLLAAGAGWFGLAAVGMFGLAAAWLLRTSAQMLRRIERDDTSSGLRIGGIAVFLVALDLAFVLIAAGNGDAHIERDHVDRLFPPFMLLAMLRILPRVVNQRVATNLADRGILGIVLGTTALAGVQDLAIHILAAAAALAAIVLPAGELRITRA